MKKFFSLLTVLCLSVAVVGCGDDKKNDKKGDDKKANAEKKEGSDKKAGSDTKEGSDKKAGSDTKTP